MNNEPLGDALAYLSNYARPVETNAQAQDPHESFVRQFPKEVAYIQSYSGNFSFLLNMKDALKQWGRLTERQLAAVQKCMASERAYKERQAVETNHGSTWGHLSPPASALDLSKVPDGRYAVPGGETRLKVLIERGSKNWAGFIFVKDAAEYGKGQRYGIQAPGKPYQGKIIEDLMVIASNPEAASRAYGRLVGRCGVCGRPLEDEASVAAGIGPICASKF